MGRRIDLVGRHEMVHARVAMDADLGQGLREDSRLQRLLLMRELAVPVEDWKRRYAEDVAVEGVRLERADQRGDAGGALLHLRRDGARRRRCHDRAGPYLLPNEGGHELVALQS